MKKAFTVAVIVFLFLFSFTALAQTPLLINWYAPTAPGYVFLEDQYLRIIDNTGHAVFLDGPSNYSNFQKQSDDTLSYVENNDTIHNLNSNYQEIETIQPIGDSQFSGHESLKLGPGHWIYIVYDEVQPFDLSAYGGYVTATVVSTIIQEQQGGAVIFEWQDIDHLPITDSVIDLTLPQVDPFHGNAIEIDTDNNLLVSFRNSSEVVKIDHITGDIIWQLGGASNQFTFANDSGFDFQHDIRRLEDGHITLFDNGQAGRGYSRSVEYALSEIGMTITRTWEITGPWAFCCGNTQRLENGNTFTNWGITGYMNEVTPGGDVVWEAQIQGGFTYRAYRFPWITPIYLPVMLRSQP